VHFVIILVIHYSGNVFLLHRYDGDAIIKVKVNGISAGIKHISVSIIKFGNLPFYHYRTCL